MHLHVHSHYSFLAGTLSVERLVEVAVRRGARRLALTDTNNVTGITEFYLRAREAGIVPIPGAELRIGEASAVVLARSWDGYADVCAAVSRTAAVAPPARILAEGERADRDEAAERPGDARTLLTDIIRDTCGDDVVVLSRDESVIRRLAARRGPGNLYAELVKADEARWPALLRACHETGVPPVATNDVYFGEPLGRKLHRILRAISTNTTVATVPSAEIAAETQYFCDEATMREWFRGIPGALENRARIAESCAVAFDMTTSKFTSYNGLTHADKVAMLRALAEQGFTYRYPRATAEHTARLEKEFRVIADMGFTDYFLVAWDVVRYASHRNYPYVGRGSGANSIVAYCLRITNVDPVELDLFFERFLNPERRSPPDFDIDFSWRIRDDVIAYVLGKYGADRTAMIGTISTFNPRGALREVGKVLGFSDAEIKQFTAMLPGYAGVRDLQDATSPFRREAAVALASPYGREWVSAATRVLDFPNHYGIHSGGVILAPRELTRYTATQVAPKGVRITQQDMFSMEDWRLEKLDILSTRGLGTFEDTMRAVELRTGSMPPVLDYRAACRDQKTREIMRTGRTVGCFYIESPAMIQLLKKLRTDTFEMLTAASSIIRPGVAQSGMMQAFIERYHDPSKIRPPHPMMGELLRSTFGVMVYQEDVIKVAHFIGGLRLGEADLLRRAMSGKMRSRDAMRALRDRFFDGCRAQGIGDDVTSEIWRQMESFAGYSFCKAHSASYAVLSFQEAYLKAHYPALFLCAVLNNQGGYYRPEVYIQEAKRLGIRVLLPNVNASGVLHTCPDDASIQLGFLHVKDLTERSTNALLAARDDGGPYTGIDDFLHRSGTTGEDAFLLIRCGACDCFGEERPAMLVKARLHFRGSGARPGQTRMPLPAPLFESDLPKLKPYTASQVAQIELETFSYTVSTHVLSHFASQLAGTVPAAELERHRGRRVVVGGWMIAAKLTRTRKHERMMFMNLEDGTGTIDVVLFPACYDAYAPYLRTAGPYKVWGRVKEEFGVISLVADTIEVLTEDAR